MAVALKTPMDRLVPQVVPILRRLIERGYLGGKQAELSVATAIETPPPLTRQLSGGFSRHLTVKVCYRLANGGHRG